MAKKINEISGMPQIAEALDGWQNQVTLQKITQTIVNGFSTNSTENITFKGVIQPLRAKEIQLKPEAQRAFRWLQIHSFSGNNNLNVNDRIIFNNDTYKIMANLDYSLNGYIEYHAIEDFE